MNFQRNLPKELVLSLICLIFRVTQGLLKICYIICCTLICFERGAGEEISCSIPRTTPNIDQIPSVQAMPNVLLSPLSPEVGEMKGSIFVTLLKRIPQNGLEFLLEI